MTLALTRSGTAIVVSDGDVDLFRYVQLHQAQNGRPPVITGAIPLPDMARDERGGAA